MQLFNIWTADIADVIPAKPEYTHVGYTQELMIPPGNKQISTYNFFIAIEVSTWHTSLQRQYVYQKSHRVTDQTYCQVCDPECPTHPNVENIASSTSESTVYLSNDGEKRMHVNNVFKPYLENAAKHSRKNGQ